jgi:hypothetical protein
MAHTHAPYCFSCGWDMRVRVATVQDRFAAWREEDERRNLE